MKIFIVGNINVGKSFISKHISKIFPKYKMLAIDDFRMRFGDGTLETEMKVRKMFAEEILANEDALVEYSGGASITNLFIDQMEENSFIVIEVTENLEICLKRVKMKDFSQIPYPKFEETIDQTIQRLDQEFKNGLISTVFKDKYLRRFVVNSHDDITKLPLVQYESALKVRSLFNDGQNSLVAFGSLGRGDINNESDIDLFLLTKQSVAGVLKVLRPLFNRKAEWIVQKNFIAGFYRNQLVEIKVVKRAEEMALFYVKSEIKERKKTILLGNSDFADRLFRTVDSFKDDFVEEFEYTLGRLKYYVRSLERIIPKNDIYKFFFHNNIVIHEYVRISYFLANYRAFAYLPKNAIQFVDQEVLQSMTFNFGDNQMEHVKKINRIISALVPKAHKYLDLLREDQSGLYKKGKN